LSVRITSAWSLPDATGARSRRSPFVQRRPISGKPCSTDTTAAISGSPDARIDDWASRPAAELHVEDAAFAD
jgi:hypothetical protein